MFVIVTDCTLRKIMSANDQDIVAVTGRAHCQRQVAFFKAYAVSLHILFLQMTWWLHSILMRSGTEVVY